MSADIAEPERLPPVPRHSKGRVPTDRDSCNILFTFSSWVVICAVLNYVLCSVKREPIPARSESEFLTHPLQMPISIGIHDIGHSFKDAIDTKQWTGLMNQVNQAFNQENAPDQNQTSHFGSDDRWSNVNFKLSSHISVTTHDTTSKLQSETQPSRFVLRNKPDTFTWFLEEYITHHNFDTENGGKYHVFLIPCLNENDQNNAEWLLISQRSMIRCTDIPSKTQPDISVPNLISSELSAIMRSLLTQSTSETFSSLKILRPTLSFTLLNGQSEPGWMYSWKFSQLFDTYLSRFFERVSDLILFDTVVDSAVVYQGSIVSEIDQKKRLEALKNRGRAKKKGSQSSSKSTRVYLQSKSPAAVGDHEMTTEELTQRLKFDRNRETYVMPSELLRSFVGSTTWNRPSLLVPGSIDGKPGEASTSVNFVVFIPPKSSSPMNIDLGSDQLTDAFVIPRFGACVVYNPLMDDGGYKNRSVVHGASVIETDDMYDVFGRFISQLRWMIGLSKTTDWSLNHPSPFSFFARMIPDNRSGVSLFELDWLVRNTILDDLQSVYSDTSELFAMLDNVSQLPISKTVADLVTRSLSAAKQATLACENGKYEECVRFARKSRILSEKAKFDSSLLPALYFSPEFTYAVYSPYFLPAFVPVILALVNWIKFKRKKQNDTT